MKKINSSGFALAETLVVTVFLMAIFSMIYANFLPLVGEYEKREDYDSVDGKYSVYWLKRMIEDASYDIPSSKASTFSTNQYVRFECSDILEDSEKQEFCINLVKNLQIEGCDRSGNGCEVFITKYNLVDFKNVVRNSTVRRYQENCSGDTCRDSFINNCLVVNPSSTREYCEDRADKKVFRSGFKDYIFNLPDYTAESLNYAKYRVIASFHNKKDNNNYYSYATIEVSR